MRCWRVKLSATVPPLPLRSPGLRLPAVSSTRDWALLTMGAGADDVDIGLGQLKVPSLVIVAAPMRLRTSVVPITLSVAPGAMLNWPLKVVCGVGPVPVRVSPVPASVPPKERQCAGAGGALKVAVAVPLTAGCRALLAPLLANVAAPATDVVTLMPAPVKGRGRAGSHGESVLLTAPNRVVYRR